jgi:hypothetical protein
MHSKPWFRRAACYLAAAAVSFSFTYSAQAFCPKNGLLCFVTAKSSGSTTHEDITRQAIEELDKSYFKVTTLTTSMEKALEQIVEANAKVDEDQTSSAKHFDGENAAGAQARLTTLKQNILDALRADPINSAGARENLGSALHTIQDFYSHSNWVEQANGGAHPDVARPVSLNFAGPTQATCVGFTNTGALCANSSNLATSFLTSGYYGGEDRTKPVGVGKCSHGGPLDKSSPSSDPLGIYREGINKDTRYCDISPHSAYHDTAARAAVAGTKQFIEDIKSEITVKQLKALLGAGPTLAFAIDTTGSMGSIIAGVRSTAIGMVNTRLGTDEEPLQYVLSPFNDPSVGPLTVTNNADTFKGAISGLFASGGGDCPERALTGIYNGVSAADEGGDLFFFTDATASDSHMIATVAGLATDKDIRIHAALFGSCSPIDPSYLELATRTGGQVFFLNISEAARITQLADLTARNNAVQILSVLDSFAAPKTHTVPVDSTLKRITVAVSSTDQFTLPTVTLTRPNGSVVTSADANVQILNLSRGIIISVPNPVAGAWKVTVANSAQPTYLNVQGESDLKFNSFKFAEFGGQPPHQGLMTIAGTPVAGHALYAVANLTDGFATGSFTLRRKNFDSVQSLALEQDGTDSRKFFGKITVPNEAFLAYVNGTDKTGAAVQRVVSVSVVPQTVSITPPVPQDLRPGKQTTLMFQVKNFGAANTFNFTAVDDKKFITAISPTNFALKTGESINVAVTLAPGASVPVGSSDTLTVAVQSTANAALRNSANLTLFVTGAAPTTGKPNFLAAVTKQEKIAEGLYQLDVRFTNTGPGTAKSFSIASLTFQTTTGSGAVTYNASLGPALPLNTPNVDVGSFTTVRLMVNVPATVKRFNLTQSGTVQDMEGASYAFSQAQSVIPK